MPSARAVNVKTDNPVLPPRFKAAVWVSPKGSSRRFLTVRIGTDAEGRGSTVEPTSAVDLDPEKARAWRSWEKHPGPTLEGRGPRSGHRGRPHRFASQEDGCDLGAIDKRPGLDAEPHAIVLGGNVRPLRTWLNGWGLRRCPGIGLESISEINSKKTFCSPFGVSEADGFVGQEKTNTSINIAP